MSEGHPGNPRLPEWAPRVAQDKIRRFYVNDARGIYDEELIDEVGFALLARCQSFLEAAEAVQGRARCPVCSTIIAHNGQKESMLGCSGCGWELSWGEYFKTIQHKQLSGAEPVLNLFRDYIQRFPQAGSPQEKVFLVDRLIHGFHWYFKTNTPTRPVAVNLIQGRLWEVIDFLDSLSYGDGNTPGVQANRADWEAKIIYAKEWKRPTADPGKENG